ncbi:MAG: type 4a pilus biogenesis protein PilO [Deltaproteobacteria bacterium]|nr:type 4a pilus biogenesis protein PilO [Deltaproteobacteria bacterium]
METGLEGKPWYFGLGLGLGITLLIAAFFHFKGFDGIRDRIEVTENRIADLEQKILEGKAAQKNLPQFKDQVARLEQELDKLLRILPARKNTPELIRRIRVLTEQAGFNLRVFDPAERLSDQEFYKVWPIKIDLLGGYHELALFFDRISRLSRIINIENLRITSHRRQESYTIVARFTAKTFVYKEPEEEPEPSPAAKKRRGR